MSDKTGGLRRWHQSLPSMIILAMEATEVSLLPLLFPAIRAGIGLSGGDLGVIIAANKVAGAAGGMGWASLAARWPRSLILAASAWLCGLMTIAMGHADGLASLLIPSCIQAAVYIGTVPIVTAAVAEVFDDRRRGRAIGVMYGLISLVSTVSGALVGQLTAFSDGWRIGFWIYGAVSIVAGAAILLWFRDPKAGATDRRASGRPAMVRSIGSLGAITAALQVFRVPSFNLILLSRLLSGHLVIISFGIQFLVGTRHFTNQTAVLVLLPYGAGICLGTVFGGFLVDRIHARHPRTGRVAFLQAAQFAFAFVAFYATQFAWEGIGIYMTFWLLLGLLQGVNPGVNRPIVMAVVAPRLRVWAFAVMVGIVEPIGWAAYSLGLWRFGGEDSLQMYFLVVLVGVMVLNGIAITPLYATYGRDQRLAAAGPGGGQN